MKKIKGFGRAAFSVNKTSVTALAAGLAVLLVAPLESALAQNNQVTPEALQQILDRLAKDEAQMAKDQAEIKDLRNQLAARPVAGSTNAAPAPAQIQQRMDKQDADITALKNQLTASSLASLKPQFPNLQFHGFGDLDYAMDTRRTMNVPGNVGGLPYGVGYYGIKNTFYLGEFDLFIKSQLSDKASMVNETVLSAGSDNHMTIDIERLYLEYRFSDTYILDMGRFHTSLGYYNDTYHHGTWLQTAIGRPTFLQFEDSGGILPVHMVGLTLHGAIPSGKLNLNYAVEVGNGEEFSAHQNLNAVQQLISYSDSKAVNLGLYAKPDWAPGLRFGANFYFDSITPDNSGTTNIVPRNDQFILAAHAIYNNANWEFLNEGYLIMDSPKGGPTHYDPAFYTQIARKFGAFTPYARFNYYHVALNDKLYTVDWAGGVNAGTHFGPSLGLRYDFTTYAALKLQYDYLFDTGYNSASRINFQACFTF
jgi:hypothetical protein